jgi:hypothetical protein
MWPQKLAHQDRPYALTVCDFSSYGQAGDFAPFLEGTKLSTTWQESVVARSVSCFFHVLPF